MNNLILQPLSIYEAKQIEPGQSKVTFDFSPDLTEKDYDKIANYCEGEIVLRYFKSNLCYQFLKQLNINYPDYWVILEPRTRSLIPDWNNDKPGDVDIILGNIINNSVEQSVENIIGIQVKIRKIKSDGDLKSFSYGTGTAQSFYTSLMGFDRTYLLHFFVREPGIAPDGCSNSWSPVHNSNFVNALQASAGLIKNKINKELYGYGWLGWGQTYGQDWRLSGGFSEEIIIPAPFRPKHEDQEVINNSKILKGSIKEILELEKIKSQNFKKRPILINRSIR